MDQSLLQSLTGCTITDNTQTLFAALMPGNMINRAAVNAFTGFSIGNAAKLAAALNPAAEIHAAIREMGPFHGMDLRTPAERVASLILKERELKPAL
ncbi:hypothetical protein AGMMS49991_04480 [Spirochaetia bacterium]|nr:hypothetical protein AGMMS49991_04480 [Spirochaetia bacterium]